MLATSLRNAHRASRLDVRSFPSRCSPSFPYRFPPSFSSRCSASFPYRCSPSFASRASRRELPVAILATGVLTKTNKNRDSPPQYAFALYRVASRRVRAIYLAWPLGAQNFVPTAADYVPARRPAPTAARAGPYAPSPTTGMEAVSPVGREAVNCEALKKRVCITRSKKVYIFN